MGERHWGCCVCIYSSEGGDPEKSWMHEIHGLEELPRRYNNVQAFCRPPLYVITVTNSTGTAGITKRPYFFFKLSVHQTMPKSPEYLLRFPSVRPHNSVMLKQDMREVLIIYSTIGFDCAHYSPNSRALGLTSL